MTTLVPPDELPADSPGTNHLHLRLSENEVVVRKNGLEFLSTRPVPLWAEVSVDLRAPRFERPMCGSGVVVDCTGSPETGYTVSVLFLDLPPASEDHLRDLALAAAT